MKLAFSIGPMLRNQSPLRLGQCLRNQSPRTVPFSAPQIFFDLHHKRNKKATEWNNNDYPLI